MYFFPVFLLCLLTRRRSKSNPKETMELFTEVEKMKANPWKKYMEQAKWLMQSRMVMRRITAEKRWIVWYFFQSKNKNCLTTIMSYVQIRWTNQIVQWNKTLGTIVCFPNEYHTIDLFTSFLFISLFKSRFLKMPL